VDNLIEVVPEVDRFVDGSVSLRRSSVGIHLCHRDSVRDAYSAGRRRGCGGVGSNPDS